MYYANYFNRLVGVLIQNHFGLVADIANGATGLHQAILVSGLRALLDSFEQCLGCRLTVIGVNVAIEEILGDLDRAWFRTSWGGFM